MNLLVNVTSLLGTLTGIGNYTLHLLSEMLNDPRFGDIQGIGGIRWYDRRQLTAMVQTLTRRQELAEPETRNGAFSASEIRDRRRQLVRRLPGANTAVRYLAGRTAASRSAGLDDYLYWEPSYLLQPIQRPAIATIHDLSHVFCPQFHPRSRVRQLDRHLAHSIQRCQRVVTVSEFSRQQIVSHFGVESDNISIVPPAVADIFRNQPETAALQSLKVKYALPDRFILSVGTLEPRKNLDGLLRAYQLLDESIQKHYPLVIAGSSGWKFERTEKLMQPLLKRDRALKLGYVPAVELPLLYRLATVLAYPSFYEGFGMPVAEAMASGLAVVTSDRTALPETSAGSAEQVDPDDSDDIVRGLTRVLDDETYRAQLAIRGRERSAAYTWQNSASRLAGVLSGLDGTPGAVASGVT